MYSLVIVDDESYIRELLGSVFRWSDMGFDLKDSFADTDAALAYLRERPVDVLLADIQLGSGESGLELAAEAQKIHPHIAVVILSAHSDFEYAQTALRISAYDYLLKPVTHESVATCFARLKRMLDAKNAADTASKPSAAHEEEIGDYRIALVRRHIEKHVGEDITLESVADLVSMNSAYFSRFFKRHTGVHFADYLAERRMEKAIEYLRNPRYRIFEICTKVGYFSKQNFYKRFRQHTGRTPVEYRNEVLKVRDEDDES
ncbi:MAG: response regulator [Oscillospiraceae bacterium]|nr:response regulator [Oscillospiraceae bacterium]